jgi:hypothetical protein
MRFVMMLLKAKAAQAGMSGPVVTRPGLALGG